MPSATSIRSARDFRRVYTVGCRIRRAGMTIHLAPRDDGGSATRLGLVVPGRLGTAVERNRIRRRLRAAFRACRPPSPCDVVVRPDASLKEAPFEEIVRALCGVIEKAAA